MDSCKKQLSSRALLRSVTAVIVLVLILAVASDALAQRERRRNSRKNNGKSPYGTIEQNKQALQKAQALSKAAREKAETAAYEARNAQAEVDTLRGQISNLQAHIELSVNRLRQIEVNIINRQEDDSPLSKALADVERAEEDFASIRERIFNSTAYKVAYQRALASSNRTEELPRVRSTFINESEDLQVAKSHMDASRTRFAVILTEVLKADDDWFATAKAIRESKAELARAQAKLKNSLIDGAAAKSEYRAAVETAAPADFIAQRSAQIVKQLQAKKKSRGGSSSNKRKR